MPAAREIPSLRGSFTGETHIDRWQAFEAHSDTVGDLATTVAADRRALAVTYLFEQSVGAHSQMVVAESCRAQEDARPCLISSGFQ